MERKAEASLLGLEALEAEEVEGRGGGGGGGIVVEDDFLWALIAAEVEDDESSVRARISVLDTLALFLCPHCNSMSPPLPPQAPVVVPPQLLGLALGLGVCWVFADGGGGGESWLLSDWGEVVGAAASIGLLWWSWVLDGDLNLNPLPSRVEQLVLVVVLLVTIAFVLVFVWRILPLMLLDFFPLLKGRQSGLTL